MVDRKWWRVGVIISPFIIYAHKKRGEPRFASFWILAEWTGLEPATPGVTGRYSNQLNYHSGNI